MATITEIVKAADLAEQKKRDLLTLLRVQEMLREVIDEAEREDIVLRFGEEVEEYNCRLLEDSKDFHTWTKQMILGGELFRTKTIASAVMEWTGEMRFGLPIMNCDENESDCKWDFYYIAYSLVLRQPVILAVVRGLTKEQCNKIHRS